MKPKQENAPSLRSGFRPDSEALYIPSGSNFQNMSAEEIALHQTIERYNLVNNFINSVDSD